MKRIAKIAGILVAALAGLILLVIVILKLIPDNQYKNWIVSAVESATGRDFEIDSLELDFGSTLRMKAGGVRLANAEWADDPDMVSVGTAEAGLRLISLLNGIAEISASIDQARVNTQIGEDGASNWAMGEPGEDQDPSTAEETEDGLPVDLLIRELRIEDSGFGIISGPGAKPINGHIESLSVETPQADTRLDFTGSVESIPITISGNLGKLDRVLDKGSSPLELDYKVNENIGKIAGNWGPMMPEPNLSLKLQAAIDSPTPLAKLLGYDIVDFGNLTLNTEITASQGIFTIANLATNLDGQFSGAQIEGSVGNLKDLKGVDLIARIETQALGSILETLGISLPVDVPPDVEVEATVQGGIDALDVKEFTVRIQDEGVDIILAGTLERAIRMQGLDGTLNASIDSISRLSKYAGFELPDLGALEITGKVSSVDGVVSLADVDAKLISDNININLTGDLDDVVSVSGVNANVAANISSLTEKNLDDIRSLLKNFEVEIPLDLLPQSLRLDGQVSGDLSELAIRNLDAEAQDTGIHVTVTGDVGNVMAPAGVEARVHLKADTLSALSRYAGVELPDKGAMDVEGTVASSGDTYALNDVIAKLGTDTINVDLSGEMDDLLGLNGIDAEAKATIDSLSALNEFIPAELPDTDPVNLDAKLDQSGSDGAAAVSLTAQSSGTKIHLAGNLAELKSAEDLKANIEITADSLSSLNQFTGMELPGQGPLELSGTAKIKGKQYSLDDFKLVLADQGASGQVGLVLPDGESGTITLNGDLHIAYLDLTPLLDGDPGHVPAAAPEQPTAPEPIATDESGRLFSTQPLPLDKLRLIDADFSVNADKLKIRHADIQGFTTSFSLHDGDLKIDPLKSSAGAGRLDGRLHVDGSRNPAVLDVDLVVKDYPMAVTEGTFDLNLNLNGQGASVAQIMGSLNGEAIALVRNLKIEQSFATSFGSGLFSFSGQKDYTTVDCGAIRMEIKDGYADFDNQLAVQLTDVTWFGGGDINFKTEKIGVGIKPRVRKGIDIGAGNLASLFYLGGTLKHPTPQINPTDVAKKYGKYMAYVSTGGLSFLAELAYKTFRGDEDLCAKILGGTVFGDNPDQASEGKIDPGKTDSGTEETAAGAGKVPSEVKPAAQEKKIFDRRHKQPRRMRND